MRLKKFDRIPSVIGTFTSILAGGVGETSITRLGSKSFQIVKLFGKVSD